MRKISLIPCVLSAGLTAFSGCRAVQKSESDVKFIGGEAALTGEYVSTVYFQRCTAAKIGDRHFLTAAHCLFKKESGRPAYDMVPGSKANLLVGISREQGKLIPVTIASVAMYPGFELDQLDKAYAKLDGKAPAVINEVTPTLIDLAVIAVNEETPELPPVGFDEQALPNGTNVAVGGFGCEKEGEEATTETMRLKYANVPTDLAKGTLVSWRADSAQGYRSTCHGDSGGPVYRTVNGEKRIVGVNSGSPKGYSVFTLLAGSGGAKALAWIRQELQAPVVPEKVGFKVMKCRGVPATQPSQDGILRSYEFDGMELAIRNDNSVAASIDKFKVTIRPEGSSNLNDYALTVKEAKGCENGVLCYLIVYTEKASATKKLLAVQMKAGNMSVYEGEIPKGTVPLGVPLASCELSDKPRPVDEPVDALMPENAPAAAKAVDPASAD